MYLRHPSKKNALFFIKNTLNTNKQITSASQKNNFALLLWITLLLVLTACSTEPNSSSAQHNISKSEDHSDLIGKLVDIPSGEFLMGDDNSTQPDEHPSHQVRVTRFRVARTEVTLNQYQQFVSETHYEKASPCWGWEEANLITKSRWTWKNPGFSQTDAHPVVCVSWEDAHAFIKWLNQKFSPTKPYRLLTEAEWEYVARAGKHETFPWNDEPVNKFANCWTCDDAFKFTSPVGSFAANAWGIQDLSGNVWEWVQDCYSRNYLNTPLNGAAQEFSGCPSRVVRGGSWADKVGFLRSAYRLPYLAGYRNQAVGFRIAQDR